MTDLEWILCCDRFCILNRGLSAIYSSLFLEKENPSRHGDVGLNVLRYWGFEKKCKRLTRIREAFWKTLINITQYCWFIWPRIHLFVKLGCNAWQFHDCFWGLGQASLGSETVDLVSVSILAWLQAIKLNILKGLGYTKHLKLCHW